MTTMTLFLTATAFLVCGLALAQNPGGPQHINVPGRTSELPFSDGVLVGDTLYMSGKLGLLPGTRKVPEDVDQEIKLILDGMKATLEQAGMSMNDLVFVQVFCPDLTLYDKFNGVYRTYFSGGKFPARAFLGSGPLLFGARFEVQGIAYKSSTR